MKIFTPRFVSLLAVSLSVVSLSVVSVFLTTGLRSVSAQGMPQGAPNGAPQVPPALQKDVQEMQILGANFQKSLTPAQQQKMKALQAKYSKMGQDFIAPFVKKYGQKPTPAQVQEANKELKPKMMKLQTDAEKEMKGLLTPTQLKAFNTLQAKQKALMAKMQASQKPAMGSQTPPKK